MSDLTQAQQQVAGLRALANLLEVNPDLADDLSYSMGHGLLGMPLHNDTVTDQRARLAEWSRAALAHGGKVAKGVRDDKFEVAATFGPLRVRIIANRDEVCERIVTGTETVTRAAPDPTLLAEVPIVEVTEEVETVEWICRPLLAATNQAVTA